MAQTGPLADIIIRAKGGAEMTAAAIRSIADNTPPEQYRLILVDDGSDPPLRDALAKVGLKPGYIVRHEESRGAVSATNSGLGIALASEAAPAVVILDNDIEIPAGDRLWLERFVLHLLEYDDTAAVGATSGAASAPQHVLAAPAVFTRDCSRGSKIAPPVPAFVSFACCLRKAAVREVGFWDTRYDPGQYEDTDYSLQLRYAGWQIRVASSVYIHHKCHATFGPQWQGLMARNRTQFVKKWGMGRLLDDGFVAPEEAMKALQHAVEGRAQQQQAGGPNGQSVVPA